MMPLGSLTADQEIVNGSRTLAPAAGARSVGAAGCASATPRPAVRQRRPMNSNRASPWRIFMMSICFLLRPHCTFAVTDAVPVNVNVQPFVLFPPLEQAPDQIASRPLVTLSVIAVPVENDAEPVLPTATLMPAGLDVTRSPLRPVAVTLSVAV